MSSVRWRAILVGALSAAAALRLAWVMAAGAAAYDRRYYCGEGMDVNVEAGHALIHGLPHERVFRTMPAGSVANALMCRRIRGEAVLALPAAALALDGLLVFGLGALIGGGAAGALGLALFAATVDWSAAFGERWLFTFSLLLVAFLAAWRARSPSTAKTALLAAAVGLSLNVLSVLFLLPPLLAAWEWRPGDGRAEKERRVNAAILLAVPALLLLPWTLAAWQATGDLTVLERGRGNANVITGALGLVKTVGPGSPREVAAIPDTDSALGWAAREVARHPARYLSAVARRLLLAASYRPWILAGALLSLWLLRRRPGQLELGGLLLYFLGIHCLMPVEPRYFLPLWPLAGAIAAGLAGLGREAPPRPRWAAGLAACAFLPFAALAAYAQGLVLAYPSRSAAPTAWEREAARGSGDAWLQGALGRRLLAAGRPAEAAEALTRALRLVPEREHEQLLSWALMIRGGTGYELSERLARDPDPMISVRQLVMQAIGLLRSGRAEAAAEAMARAEALQLSWSASWGGSAPEAARDSLRHWARTQLRFWPDPVRLAVLEGIDGARGETRRRLEGLDYLSRDRLRDPGGARLIAQEFVRLEAPGRAVDVLRELAAREPRDLQLRLDLALLAHSAGRREAARAALGEARALARQTEDQRRVADAYRATGDARRAAAILARLPPEESSADDGAARARLHMELKEYGAALRLLDELARLNPGSARVRNDRGVVLALMGREREAAAEFRAALALDPGFASAAQSLRALRARGGYDGRTRSAPSP